MKIRYLEPRFVLLLLCYLLIQGSYMQAPDSIQNFLNQEMAATKKNTKPGLYTKLTIFHEKLGKIVVTTKDIIDKA